MFIFRLIFKNREKNMAAINKNCVIQWINMPNVQRNSNVQQQQNNDEQQRTGMMRVRKNPPYYNRKMKIFILYLNNWFEKDDGKSCHETILIYITYSQIHSSFIHFECGSYTFCLFPTKVESENLAWKLSFFRCT